MPLSVTYGLEQALIKSIPFVGREREYAMEESELWLAKTLIRFGCPHFIDEHETQRLNDNIGR